MQLDTHHSIRLEYFSKPGQIKFYKAHIPGSKTIKKEKEAGWQENVIEKELSLHTQEADRKKKMWDSARPYKGTLHNQRPPNQPTS